MLLLFWIWWQGPTGDDTRLCLLLAARQDREQGGVGVGTENNVGLGLRMGINVCGVMMFGIENNAVLVLSVGVWDGEECDGNLATPRIGGVRVC